MAELLGAKAGKLNISDALMISGAKIVSERMLAQVIGDGSLMSGAVKIGGAFAVNKLVGGKISDILGTALMVDGAEDLIQSVFGGINAGGIFGKVRSEVEVI